MRLLIDAGNTRIKWGLAENGELKQEGNLAHSQVNELAALCADHRVDDVWGSLVAGESIRSRIEAACPVPVRWIHSERERGELRNHYRNIEEHGSDRWLAVLALHERHQGDVVLASLGTALTVEALSAEGEYLGGLIVPGLRMMLDSLSKGTAGLQSIPGSWASFPQSTSEAMASGALDAMAGAITRLRDRLAEHTGRPVSVVLTGGNAPLLLPLLAPPCQIMDNLVIRGLLKVSNET